MSAAATADIGRSVNNSINLVNRLTAADTFDYIVIGECHHAATDIDKKIIDYF